MSPELTRRQFLSRTGAAVAAGAALAYDPLGFLRVGAAKAATPRTLVLITLDGGNDSLNTLVPYLDSRYQSGRQGLALQLAEVLPLDLDFALNAKLATFKKYWDAKRLAIVRGVGYPESSRSHFRSMDIWQTASPASSVSTGWLARWMEATGASPLTALAVGPHLPRMLLGERLSGVVVPSGTSFRLPGSATLVDGFVAMTNPDPGDGPLVRAVAQSAGNLVDVSRLVSDALTTYPAAKHDARNPLAVDLDIVARLIKADLPSRAYVTTLRGFDTHINQRSRHPVLLSQLDGAVNSFFASLAAHPRSGDVVVVAYSEFGRRLPVNGSVGTEHGKAGTLFVTGAGVRGGYYGAHPDLGYLDDGDLRMTTDFRSVYATLLGKVLATDPDSALDGDYPLLGFLP